MDYMNTQTKYYRKINLQEYMQAVEEKTKLKLERFTDRELSSILAYKKENTNFISIRKGSLMTNGWTNGKPILVNSMFYLWFRYYGGRFSLNERDIYIEIAKLQDGWYAVKSDIKVSCLCYLCDQFDGLDHCLKDLDSYYYNLMKNAGNNTDVHYLRSFKDF